MKYKQQPTDKDTTKMDKLTNKVWLKAAATRAIKTVAQTALGVIGASVVLSDVNWVLCVSAICVSGVTSILTSLAGLPEVSED